MEFNNIEELERFLQSQVADVMKNEMKDMTKRLIQENVVTNVYDAYTPSWYERKGVQGGLLDPKTMIDTVSRNDDVSILSVESRRMDENRNVSAIVTTGEGYTQSRHIGPRPFVLPASMEIEQKGLHNMTMKNGLRKRGIIVT